MLELERRVAYLFPGQGSQGNGQLDQRSVQLAVVVNSCFLLDYGRQLNPVVAAIKPVCFAGHSVGMWLAVYAARMIDYNPLLETIEERAALMKTIDPGKMAAVVGVSWYEAPEVWSAEGISLAAINCPGQFVISGSESAIAAAKLVKQPKMRVLDVKAAGANHSGLMEPIQPEFRKVVRELNLKKPAGFIMLNTSGLATQSVSLIREESVVHLSRTVNWEQSVRNMLLMGVDTFIEWGADILSKFVKRIDPEVRVISIINKQQAEGLTL